MWFYCTNIYILCKTNKKFAGLFQRGISQSGTNLASWARPAHENVAPKRAAQLALSQGCPKEGNDWKQVIACLRRADAANITRYFYDFFVSIRVEVCVTYS